MGTACTAAKRTEDTINKVLKRRGQIAEIWYRLRRNKLAMFGLFIISIAAFIAIFADKLAPYDATEQDIYNRFAAPCLEHWFGTDNYGRDILSRILIGSRISLLVGVVATAISTVSGIFLGAIAGYYGGRIDNYIMRFLDVFMAIPNLLLAIAIAAAMGPGVLSAMIAVGVADIPRMARTARAPIMMTRNQEYIEAAQAINASTSRIILRHVLPNSFAPIIVQITFNIARAIITASGLSFLGMGVQPPTPEWGSMLSAGRGYLRDYWWVTTFPGAIIMITVFSFNVLGDGLRDALDPRLKN